MVGRAEVRTHIDVPASEELHCIYFDQQGLLWMGTSAGIRSYDGYAVREQFANVVRNYPQLGSDVRCLTTDAEGHLWAGTNNGLVCIDTNSGESRLFVFPKQSQQIIYCLFTAHDGTVYVGTDDGFSVFDKARHDFEHFNVDRSKALFPDGRTDKYTGWGVKDFCETPDGDILIGTWNQGLWRYFPKTKRIRAYATVNWMNSAFTLCVDHKKRLWIGTQAYGVQRADRLDDYKLETLKFVNPETANPAPHRVVYDLQERADGYVYACTGDTISALTGPDGAQWIATRFGGIVRVHNSKISFRNYATGLVQSFYTDDGCKFYFGNGALGLGWTDIQTGELRHNNEVPGFSSLPTDGTSPKRITSIISRHNGELWMTACDNGILVSRPDGTNRTLYTHSRQMPFLKDNVTALCESRRDHTLWIGQRQGVSYLTTKGMGVHLDVKSDSVDLTGYFMVNHIMEDHKGRIWVSSANGGIVRITGNPADSASLKIKQYFNTYTNITACFEDSHHQLWAIGSFGLLKYNAEKNIFDIVDKTIHLAGKKVLAINEDQYGALWLATDCALVRLDSESGHTISFTEQDGLASTIFFPNATCRFCDELFFGTNKGFIAFHPQNSYNESENNKSNILITDILIDGISVLSFDSLIIADITSQQPSRTREIAIPASVSKFGIEFSLLSYTNQDEIQYAYRLEGYDEEWQYVDGNIHRAIFDRVPSGTYHFQLRAADSRGKWYELPYTIEIHVLAPWYATWWAYIIYTFIIAIIGYFIWKYQQMQREMEASRRFSSIMQSAQLQVEPTLSDEKEENKGESLLPSHDIAAQRNAEFIAHATQLVRDHLDDSDYNRDRMAADLCMSVSSLYGRMRECTGLSIQIFIQNIRLNAAADILRREPDIRISELAYRVGFNTPKYFSQCFKKEFGVLPGDYLKDS